MSYYNHIPERGSSTLTPCTRVGLNVLVPQEISATQLIIDTLKGKVIFNSLISQKNLLPPTTHKRLTEYASQRLIIYSLAHRVTKEIKRVFML